MRASLGPTRFQEAYLAPRTPPPSPEAPARYVAKHLSRDDRIKIIALREDVGWTYQHVASTTGVTKRQIQHACTHPVTPNRGNRKGRRALGP